MKMLNQIAIFRLQKKKRKIFFIYVPLALELTSYLLIILSTFLICTSFVKARYLLKMLFHFSVSVKSNTTFSNNPVLYWFGDMRSATESKLLQGLQADRCRKGKAQLAAQHGRNDYTAAEMSITQLLSSASHVGHDDLLITSILMLSKLFSSLNVTCEDIFCHFNSIVNLPEKMIVIIYQIFSSVTYFKSDFWREPMTIHIETLFL